MALKPMLFNTGMVQAILSGQKTCTRRLVKPQPTRPYIIEKTPTGFWMDMKTGEGTDYQYKPPCHPGDILYVRETWGDYRECSLSGEDGYYYLYRADYPDGATSVPLPESERTDYADSYDLPRWRPSIHMPKEAARIFLRVTDVRVERLHTSFFEPICPIFAVQAEGVDVGDTCRECIENYGVPCCVDTIDEDGSNLYGGECGMLDENRGKFSDLWDSTIKPADLDRYGWAANPWVWAIRFERISKEAALGGESDGKN